jgi:hypothetical protein
MYPSAFISTFKHIYNTPLEGFLNDVVVNSLCIYMDREDFIDSVNDTDENIQIADRLIPYFYKKGVIVLNQKSIIFDNKKEYVEKNSFASVDIIEHTLDNFLKEKGNLFLLYTVTYNKSQKEYVVMGKYLLNTSRNTEQFVKEYVKTKRVYLINKLLDITNDNTD